AGVRLGGVDTSPGATLRGRYPRGGAKLLTVSVARLDGLDPPPSCLGDGSSLPSFPRIVLGGDAPGAIWFAQARRSASLVLPVSSAQLFGLRRGGGLARRIAISGPCDQPVLTAAATTTSIARARARSVAPFAATPPIAPRPGPAVSEDVTSCAVDGEFWVYLHRTGGARTHA
ncbi:MAG: hypothetical protein JWR63_2800, partial [Conexibacter sp.]|nr:hypothetical protein [Conexibacter sp.]